MKWSACQHHLASVHFAAQPHTWKESCKLHGQKLASLRVTVVNAAGKALELQEACSVPDLKLAINKHWHIPADSQMLAISGCVLGEADSLMDFVSAEQNDPKLIVSLVTSSAEHSESAIETAPVVNQQWQESATFGGDSERYPGSDALGESHEHFSSDGSLVQLEQVDESVDVVVAMELLEEGTLLQDAMEPSEEVRPRRRPSKRMRLVCSNIMQKIMETYSNDPERLCQAASFFSARSNYLAGLCRKYQLPTSCEPLPDEQFQMPKLILDLWRGFAHHAPVSDQP